MLGRAHKSLIVKAKHKIKFKKLCGYYLVHLSFYFPTHLPTYGYVLTYLYMFPKFN
jgi:hypothetical protein